MLSNHQVSQNQSAWDCDVRHIVPVENVPQRLKPSQKRLHIGTAEAVPFPKPRLTHTAYTGKSPAMLASLQTDIEPFGSVKTFALRSFHSAQDDKS